MLILSSVKELLCDSTAEQNDAVFSYRKPPRDGDYLLNLQHQTQEESYTIHGWCHPYNMDRILDMLKILSMLRILSMIRILYMLSILSMIRILSILRIVSTVWIMANTTVTREFLSMQPNILKENLNRIISSFMWLSKLSKGDRQD